jgi:hypothetical protein
MHAEIRSTYSPNAFKYFPHIRRWFCVPQITPICHFLHIRLNTFPGFPEYAKILSAHSHRCLNTFRVFSVYAERMKTTQKEIFTFNNAPGLQRDSVSKKSNRELYACIGWTIYNIYFLVIFKTKTALCVYGEYAKRRNKYWKCAYLS